MIDFELYFDNLDGYEDPLNLSIQGYQEDEL